MLKNLRVYNFSHQSLPLISAPGPFLLKTCQRTLIAVMGPPDLNLEDDAPFYQGEEAYRFLLEVLCGLQSRLVGENEIVSQFRRAFQVYLSSPKASSTLQKILEKLFQDGKAIRTQYLRGISQKTYACLARRKFVAQKARSLVIVGSGSLAEDLIFQWKKRTCCSLCTQRSASSNAPAKTPRSLFTSLAR